MTLTERLAQAQATNNENDDALTQRVAELNATVERLIDHINKHAMEHEMANGRPLFVPGDHYLAVWNSNDGEGPNGSCEPWFYVDCTCMGPVADGRRGRKPSSLPNVTPKPQEAPSSTTGTTRGCVSSPTAPTSSPKPRSSRER